MIINLEVQATADAAVVVLSHDIRLHVVLDSIHHF